MSVGSVFEHLPYNLSSGTRIFKAFALDKCWHRILINDEEINFYARARRGDEAVLIVGESVSRLDDASKLGQLHRKLAAVRVVESLPLVPLIVTHFAHPKLLAQDEQEGIIVVQSFEW